jgi:Protein of unknown function (DUF1778)
MQKIITKSLCRTSCPFRSSNLINQRVTVTDNLPAGNCSGGKIWAMTKSRGPISLRRPKAGPGKQILVYFTSEERKIVDAAAAVERRSISGFVANVAISAAEEILSKRSKI